LIHIRIVAYEKGRESHAVPHFSAFFIILVSQPRLVVAFCVFPTPKSSKILFGVFCPLLKIYSNFQTMESPQLGEIPYEMTQSEENLVLSIISRKTSTETISSSEAFFGHSRFSYFFQRIIP
jgi:hypothetical protein